MKIETDTIRILIAEEGMALCRKTDGGPTRITRVALSSFDSEDNWTDCEYADDPEDGAAGSPSVRTWTPLAIKRACGERWDEVKAALLQAGIFDEFVMAAEIREDDDAFKSGYAWAVQAYGQETVDAVLEAAEKGA